MRCEGPIIPLRPEGFTVPGLRKDEFVVSCPLYGGRIVFPCPDAAVVLGGCVPGLTVSLPCCCVPIRSTVIGLSCLLSVDMRPDAGGIIRCSVTARLFVGAVMRRLKAVPSRPGISRRCSMFDRSPVLVPVVLPSGRRPLKSFLPSVIGRVARPYLSRTFSPR
jgi:hypothetical protein